ncbi:hypothetical protein K2Z83_04650 [Oscillochloris sp. ZM17-4]|uniref:hypothetical protein n=1 Tax=Oscillochloris sp. ZM17-4 TaxID=2866714 RepID=UPI001C72D6DC|nr:hypothetical protein [Oscillochloris sp. ZM17-4]MBX0326970.1 hypothetical protein [Oscillochloris sp. ZM17-4]
MKRINWWFVFGTAAQLSLRVFSLILAVYVGLVGATLLPPGFDDVLRADAVRVLAQLSDLMLAGLAVENHAVVASMPAAFVTGLAFVAAWNACKDIVADLSTDAGVTKREYILMARCAARGCSLSIAESEGYVAVRPNQSRERLWRIADVEQFLLDLEGTDAPASADPVSDRAHAAAQ